MKKSKVLSFGMVFLLPALLWAGSGSVAKNDYLKGLTLYTQGKYESALVRFQMAIDGDWAFWQSYQMLGYCCFEMRDKEGALNAFEQSLKINPDNPKLAKIYNDLKSGALDIPVRPVEAALPVGTPVYIQTYYTYNR